jgi:serine/threonine protein kinase
MAKQFSPAELRAMLDDALNKFQSVRLPEAPQSELMKYSDEERWIPCLAPEYRLYPDKDRALLGRGGYGAAYKTQNVKNPNAPLCVVKVIVKQRVCTNALQIQHMCAELAVSGLVHNQHLNHRLGLFHNDTHMFIMLELCAGPRPDVLTRIAHVIANRKPSRIPEIEAIFKQYQQIAKEQHIDTSNEEAFGDFVDRAGLINRLAVECGVSLSREKAELPVAADLFGMIVANRKLSDPAAQVITRQILIGIEALHQNQIVHRDLKTENVILSITRKATLNKDQSGQIVSVSFTEKFDVKVIDFGLVKYLNVNDAAFGVTATPGAYIRASQPGQQQGVAAAPADPFASDPFAAGGDFDVTSTVKATGPAFNVAVTPACTEIYAPFEVIHGILQNGVGRHKWSSPKASLPKVDVYGVGTMLFCMSNGRPPFRPAASNAPVSREEKMRQIERQILVGPTFGSTTSQASKEMTLKMMIHDANMRPTATECLAQPFVAGVGDTVITEFKVDGTRECGLLKTHAPLKKIVDEEDPSSPYTAEQAQNDAEIEAAILAAARDREDDGDNAGKVRAQ